MSAEPIGISPTGAGLTPAPAVSACQPSSCAAPSGDDKGIVVYVDDEAQARQALSTFDLIDAPPDCCRLRTRALRADQPAAHPQIVTAVAEHTGSWPLPLTVVDGSAQIAGRLPTLDELSRFTTQKVPGHAPGLVAV